MRVAMQESSNTERLGTATDALLGSMLLYFVFPIVLSLVLGRFLFTHPTALVTAAPGSHATDVSTPAMRASMWTQQALLPPPLRSGAFQGATSSATLDSVRWGYVAFAAFALYYGCFAAFIFLTMFRLIARNWREQSRTGAFNTERLRSVFYNAREFLAVFGIPAVIVLALGNLISRGLEHKLLAWTAIPGVVVPQWQLFLILVAVCLHSANRWEREEALAHTLMYQAKFGKRNRSRRTSVRYLADTFGMNYIDRAAHYYNVKWVSADTGKLQPRMRSDWYLKGKPGAHPIYDIWKCGCGYAANILHGAHDGHRVHLFDYHYCRSAVIHWGAGVWDFVIERRPRDSSVAAMELPCHLPSLSIYPQTVWDDFAKLGGGVDLDMESFEFSQAYRIWANDRRFAYAVCNVRMMEFLSGHPGMALRIAENVLAIRLPELAPVDRMAEFRDQLLEAYRLIPGFVFTDAAAAQKNTG